MLPQFGGLIGTLLAFVVALSVIVAIHEYGHYIVGRWSGIKADVFSLGFGPVLFSRVDKHGTRWQFALLPLGGYVKFRGDANAASAPSDEDSLDGMTAEERRSTMQGAPLWARTATVAAGPVFNFILSIIVFTGIFMYRGDVADPLRIGAMQDTPYTNELQLDDVLLEIDGKTVPPLDEGRAYVDLIESIQPAETVIYTVERDGVRLTVPGPYPYMPMANNVVPRSAAFDAGMRSGDLILTLDGERIFAFDQLKTAVESSEGRTLPLTVWRDGEVRDVDLTPKRTDEPQPDNSFKTYWRIGIVGGTFYDPATETVGVGAAFMGGLAQTWGVIEASISGLWHIVTGAISTCNLSGPIGIAETSGAMASQGASSFVWFIAVLSTAVGMLNLFPVPVLDGGHLCFYAYEAVTRRKPNEQVLRALMGTGLFLILGLMGFALFNDIFCP